MNTHSFKLLVTGATGCIIGVVLFRKVSEVLSPPKQKEPPPGTVLVPAKTLGFVKVLYLLYKLGKENMAHGFGRIGALLADETGSDAIQINLPSFGFNFVLLHSPDLIKEMYTQSAQTGGAFGKDFALVPGAELFLDKIGRGLFFQADTDEYWGIAHRILMKPFSRQGLMTLLPLINMQGNQLVSCIRKSLAKGVDRIRIYDLTVNMAVETIATATMGVSLGCFTEDRHPFVLALNSWLKTLNGLAQFPAWSWHYLPHVRWAEKHWLVISAYVDECLSRRQKGESSSLTGSPDLLDMMLTEKDALSGKTLPLEVIKHNIFTFLFAGQDSTAAAMSSFFCLLAGHPQVEEKLVREIQEVVGNSEIEWAHLGKLKYLDWCQKETLRFMPPASTAAILKVLNRDAQVGKFFLPKNTSVSPNIFAVHMDTKVWGPDALKFRPERWENGAPHPYAYFPFSLGPRGCIGKEFSLMEQKIAIIKVLQNFILRVPSPYVPSKGPTFVGLDYKPPILALDYGIPMEWDPLQLFVGAQLTMQVFERPAVELSAAHAATPSSPMGDTKQWMLGAASAGHETPLHVFYGSDGNSTTILAEDFARRAGELGFSVEVLPLNEAVRAKCFDQEGALVVIFTATYNGLPPSNASDFVTWITEIAAVHASIRCRYAVFGCGHPDWQATYMAIPTFLDENLSALGAQQLLPLCRSDSSADPERTYQAWLSRLWKVVSSVANVQLCSAAGSFVRYALPSMQKVKVLNDPASPPTPFVAVSAENWVSSVVSVNKELTQTGSDTSVRHVELDLGGVSFSAGDHLLVMPQNDPSKVAVFLDRLGVSGDVLVSYDGSGVYRLEAVVTSAVDLMKPAQAEAVAFLASKASDPEEAAQLGSFIDTKLQLQKCSLLELLLKYLSIHLSVEEGIALLPPMKGRYYSISSSAESMPSCSITVAVIAGLSPTGWEYRGVASNYIAQRSIGDRIWVQVKDMGGSFALPKDPRAPVVMVGAGTGIAPFRGFIQQIQRLRSAGVETGPVYMFFGCQRPEKYLYQEELEAAVADGSVTELHVAFSRVGERRYVQQDLLACGDTIWRTICAQKRDNARPNGHILVCGDGARMAPDVKKAFKKIAATCGGLGESTGNAFIDQLCSFGTHERYHQDVWAAHA